MLGWARHQERNMTSLASMLVCVVSDCNWVISLQHGGHHHHHGRGGAKAGQLLHHLLQQGVQARVAVAGQHPHHLRQGGGDGVQVS